MWHGMVASLALLVAAQVEPKTERADTAGGPLAPTRIRLDFQDKTLAEIVDGVNAQAPATLALQPESRGFPAESTPETPPRRYALREPEPVTFWEAVDRIGRATQTWPVSGNRPGGGLGILLAPASADRGFACSEGAFRVVLTGTGYSSQFQFAPYFDNQPGLEQPKADGSSRRPRLTASLTIMAEPRLTIIRPVELVVREAIDDRGRSLIPAAPWRQPLEKGPGRSYPNQEYVGVPLTPLRDPGRRIRHLAGSVTIDAAPQGGFPVGRAEVPFDFADVPLP